MTGDLSRRSVLGGLGAVTLLGLAGAQSRAAAGTATPVAAAPAAGGAIDVHGHALPGFWVDALRASGSNRVSGMAIPDWSPDAAVGFLNRHCIDTQIVSLPDPAVTFLTDQAERVAMARRVNDYLATELVGSSAHPGRFGAFATLPLAEASPVELPAAIAEATRAVGQLGLDGVSLLSNYGETYLGSPTLVPLLLALNGLGAVVAVHSNAQGTAPASDLGAAILEGPFNTTRAIVTMSYLQTFTLYPNIRWVFVDAGGALPYLAYRTSLFLIYPVLWQNLGLDLADLDEGNFQFGNLHFDTAWSANASTMATLREIVPDQHILLGTDWPLSAPALPQGGVVQPELPAILGDDGYSAASRSNALTLLPDMAKRTRPASCGATEPSTNPVVPVPSSGGKKAGGKKKKKKNGGVQPAAAGKDTADVLPDTGLGDLAPIAAAGLAATLAGHTMVRYAQADDQTPGE